MKLIDRDWYGEIIKLTLKNNDRYKVESGKVPAVKVTALVRTSDGKLYEREIFDEGDYFSERERLYKESDKVVHVRWTDYLVPIRTAADDSPTVCAICGSRSPADAGKCSSCGCSMDIRVTDVKGKKR